MDNTEILFLRHGESRGNVEKFMAGQIDIPLTEKGLLQAEAAADFLLGQNIDLIYSSDLIRAFETASAFSRKSGIPILASYNELREISVGDYEGLPFGEIVDRYDDCFAMYFTSSFGVYSFPNGESTEGAGQRFYRCVEKIALSNPGKRILVATHAAVIRSFWGIINNIPRGELGDSLPFASNASVSRAVYNGTKFSAVSYSENEYLKDVGFIDYSKSRM